MESKKNKRRAQTAIELAIFGSIVIFMIGAIVNSAFNFSYQQNLNYRALRKALTVSFRFSEGIDVPTRYHSRWGMGVTSRNVASVLIIADRLSASSAKYAAIDRNPNILTGSGSHTRNLFMPVEAGENVNIAESDYFINGVHFLFTLSKFKYVKIEDVPNRIVYKQVPNHPALDWCDCKQGGPPLAANCGTRFNLDHAANPTLIDVADNECENFAWQWKPLPISAIDIENNENTSVDVDYWNIPPAYPNGTGDVKTEQVVKIENGLLTVLDQQEGDLDTTISQTDLNSAGLPRPPAGITNEEIEMWTYTKNPNSALGTYLRIDEGKLYTIDGQFSRSAQKKDSVDIIQRKVQLSNDTFRFCLNDAPTPPTGEGGPGWDWDLDTPNPVEVCCQTQSCCFEIPNKNIEKTCMVTTPTPGGMRDPVIFVRSRVKDIHGRKWITPLDRDNYVGFTK